MVLQPLGKAGGVGIGLLANPTTLASDDIATANALVTCLGIFHVYTALFDRDVLDERLEGAVYRWNILIFYPRHSQLLPGRQVDDTITERFRNMLGGGKQVSGHDPPRDTDTDHALTPLLGQAVVTIGAGFNNVDVETHGHSSVNHVLGLVETKYRAIEAYVFVTDPAVTTFTHGTGHAALVVDPDLFLAEAAFKQP